VADFKIKYGTVAEIDIDPESLASSSSRTGGVESAVVDESSEQNVGELVSGFVTVGTNPTVNTQIDIWVYAAINDTPDYPDVLDGTKSAETITSENVRNSALKLAASIIVDSTTGRTYPVAPFAVEALFGGVLPKRWGLFLSHNTGAALDATGTNHRFWRQPIQYQSV
jgi:hypothetical protein